MSANSVTLSPAPSVDSQAGSPGHMENNQSQVYKSDSDEDNQQTATGSPPATPTALAAQRLSEVCVKDQLSPTLTQPMMPLTPGAFRTNTSNVAREFFPNDSPEPNTSKYLYGLFRSLGFFLPMVVVDRENVGTVFSQFSFDYRR